MERTEFLILVEKIADGRASAEELSLYNACLKELHGNVSAAQAASDINEYEQNTLWNAIQAEIDPQPSRTRFRLNYKIAAAAMLVLTLGTAIYFSTLNQERVKQQYLANQVIRPGENKAVLTLADGRKIILNDHKEGIIPTGKDQTVHLKKNGQLVYEQSPVPVSSLPQYHKIETPVGGHYQLILPDGSKIILNSASSLRYPVVFEGGERQVELTGEGYFEITKDASKPFKVITAQQVVQVLGTRFNINAYPEERKISTTLVEGSVKVGLKGAQRSYQLKPGQQSVLKGAEFEVKSIDTEEFTAWKDGYFYFNNEHISSAMNKVAKWYNVEIVYQGDFREIYFSGSFSRSMPLASVLKILASTNKLKFKVEGRRVIVM